MKEITIFTPTYNRIHTLRRAYQALLNQTNKNFIWMIIDDGSTDDTSVEVKMWQDNDNGFPIIYIYKENGGLHTAYNTAIAQLKTELCVCVDSDDFMPNNAIELILNFWKENGNNSYAGIVGLDYDMDGNRLGDLLPDQKSVNLIDLLIGKYKIRNKDRKLIVRTDLYRKVAPMKTFPGEKNFNPHYMHLLISREYDFLVLNKNLCNVEYQEGGMTDSIFKQFFNSPNSFLQIRKLYLSFKNANLKFKIKNLIHYISSSIIAKCFWRSLIEIPYKPLAFFCIIPGFFFSFYVRYKALRP